MSSADIAPTPSSSHVIRSAQPASQPWPENEAVPTEAEAEKARSQLTGSLPPPQPATISDAWKNIKAGDFLAVHQTPCARTGFLTGIGSAAAVGALRFVLGAGVPKAANWAVGAGALGAVLQYEFCQAARRKEREKMKRVVEVYDRKQAEIKAEEDRLRARKAQEETDEARRKAERRWWKVW